VTNSKYKTVVPDLLSWGWNLVFCRHSSIPRGKEHIHYQKWFGSLQVGGPSPTDMYGIQRVTLAAACKIWAHPTVALWELLPTSKSDSWALLSVHKSREKKSKCRGSQRTGQLVSAMKTPWKITGIRLTNTGLLHRPHRCFDSSSFTSLSTWNDYERAGPSPRELWTTIIHLHSQNKLPLAWYASPLQRGMTSATEGKNYIFSRNFFLQREIHWQFRGPARACPSTGVLTAGLT